MHTEEYKMCILSCVVSVKSFFFPSKVFILNWKKLSLFRNNLVCITLHTLLQKFYYELVNYQYKFSNNIYLSLQFLRNSVEIFVSLL